MRKFLKNNLLLIYIIINILFIFSTSILDTYNFSLNDISLAYFYAFLANSFVCLSVFIYRRFVKKIYKLELIDFILLFMIIFGCIATIYAIKPNVSWNGSNGRKEGLYVLIYYYTLFYLSRFLKEKQKNIIVYFILGIGIFEVLYGSLQKLDTPLVRRVSKGDYVWVFGTLLNPNFYSTYMLLCEGFSLGLYIDSDNIYKRVLFGLLSIIFCLGLLLGDSMSCIVGLGVIAIYVFIYSIVKKLKRYVILIGTVMLAVTLIMCGSGVSHTLDDLNVMGSEINQMSQGKTDASFGTNRVGIWRYSISIVPKYIWHGTGIDCFSYAFGDKILKKDEAVVDKAHNEYLQILITEGIFALIAYLLFYSIIIIKGFKNKIYYMLPVIGYLIQAFFNISVIAVAPFFFISLGLLYTRDC